MRRWIFCFIIIVLVTILCFIYIDKNADYGYGQVLGFSNDDYSKFLDIIAPIFFMISGFLISDVTNKKIL